jgi:hypothetical protein
MSKRRRFSLALEVLEARFVLSTYYVAPGGSNSNNGSAGAPWATLQFAADRVVAGDTVIARAGNYVGFYLDTDGTAALPITFTGEPGAVIDQRNATTPDGINLEGADYIVIEGFEVINQPRTGIRSVLNHHVTIRNNICDNNSRWGILTGFSDDLLIENNTTTNSQIEHGIYVSNSGDRPVIRGNLSYNNRANGIHMNGDVSLGGDGIISNAIVENNTLHSNGLGGGSGINCDGVQNSIIRNNLIYNTSASGISLYQIDGGGGSSGNLVVNNTVLVAANGRWAMNIQSGSTNNTLRNNIFYTNHSFRGSIDISADSLPGFSSDYNVLMNRMTTNGGNSILTLAQWQAQTGQDIHSIVATPAQLFISIPNNNYRLAPTSPALDIGTLQHAPSTDRDGLPRPSGPGVDIGAYERQTTSLPAGVFTLSASTVAVNETAGTVTLSVNRTNGGNGAVTVQYNTASGTAYAGSDFTTTSGSLNWASGDTSPKTVTIPILDDATFEGNEAFTLSLSNPTGGATLGSPFSATVTIVDNEQAPTGNLQFAVATSSVNEAAGTVTLTVNRVIGSNGTVTVQYATANGSALAGSDFTTTTGTLTWAHGDTAGKTITVPIFNDSSVENTEIFSVTLSNPTGGAALGSPATVTVSIIDNDVAQPGTLQLAVSTLAVNENAGTATLSVNRVGGTSGAVSVQFATANGTATAGSDYTATTGTLTWANGESAAKSIVVPVLDNLAVEGNETFTVTLSNPTGGATLGSPTTATVTITDNDSQPPPVHDPKRRIVAGAESGNEPRVRVFDGATGQEVLSILAYPASFRGGVRVATADFNGDSFPDIVTAPGLGTLSGGQRVRIFNGITGAPLPGVWGTGVLAYTSGYSRGVNLAVGDFNRDGRPDVVTGTSSGGGPVVHVYSGTTGQALPAPWGTFNAYATSFTGGVRVAAGDVNGDGFIDLITAQAGGSGEVRVFNGTSTGSTPQLLRSFRPYFNGQAGGVAVAVGDVDNDGKAEILTGPGGAAGTVRLYGQTTTPLKSFSPFGTSYTGGTRVALGDINGDGKLDLVVAQAKGPQAKARLYDAATLQEFFAGTAPLTPFPTYNVGVNLAALTR